MYDCSHMIGERKFGRPLGMLFLALLLAMFAAGCASTPADKEAPMEPAALTAGQKTITDIQTVSTPTADKVIIKATGGLGYTSVKQHDPLGLILLFPETSLGKLASEYTPDNRTIRNITPSLSPDQKNVRLEIGLNLDLPYEVIKNGDDLEIVFTHEEEITAASDMAKNPARVTSPPNPAARPMMSGSVSKSAPTFTQSTSSVVSGKPSTITKIDFSSQNDGKSMVILGTSHPAAFDIQKIGDRRLKVRLYNTRLPEFRRNRPLITTRFESAIDRINPVQAGDAAKATDILIDLREMVPYRPVQSGNVLTLYFDPSSLPPRPMAAAKMPDWQNALNENPHAAGPSCVPAYPAATVSQAAVQPQRQAMSENNRLADLLKDNKQYTGQKIALDFYQTDIKNVFKILQQVSGKNYAVDRDVTGEVTISLDKPVPWDQVLDLILEMNQLGKVEKNDIIRIAKTDTLKKEEEAQQAKMKAIQERMEQEKTLEPLVTEYIPINYANAQNEILPHVKDILTKDRGKLTIDNRNNQLIITDTRPVLAKARQIIGEIDRVTPQVLIEARIVEINDSFNREIGMSWGAGGDDIYKGNLNGQYSYHAAMNTQYKAANVLPGQGILDFNFNRLDAWGTPFVLDAALKAMEQEGDGKIISAPKILTLDNKPAMIKQGFNVPYQVVDKNGQPSTSFKDVALTLDVTPHVTPDHRVSMKINASKDELVSQDPNTGEWTTSINNANTELLVEDGETIVIGGVAKSSNTVNESGFPILKDIPMIGWLFKTKTTDNSKRELMIFITPKIVQLDQQSLVKTEN